MGPLCISLRALFHFVYHVPTGCVWLHSHFLLQLASVAFGKGDIYMGCRDSYSDSSLQIVGDVVLPAATPPHNTSILQS